MNAQLRAFEVLKRIQHIDRPIGAEIGVYLGQMSQQLLAGHSSLFLYLVDSYADPKDQPGHYVASGDYHAKLPLAKQNQNLLKARHAVAAYKNRCIFYRMDSPVAAQRIYTHNLDKCLDFVFIDADHSYEGCRRDIIAWWPMVRPGGWISGHDYSDQFPGVRKAVNEFHGNLELELGQNYTWFVQKT